MSETTFKRGNEAYDLIVDLRSNLQGMGKGSRDFWGDDIHRSIVSDARNAIDRTWANPQAAEFLSANGNSKATMENLVKTERYEAAFKSIPTLPSLGTRDAAAAYRDTLIAAAPEPQRIQSEVQRQASALRQR